ncbi:hypothetical protein E2C01_012316 [Portunus trituberculatus]|uniref:Uncharacterized protein n=1 Tax=Portunus trituberculatus TaxID=210409 RepID=A0A5B7DDD9_PORTR|nr:hypothetical protein [Portunus trituberculatus]
MPQPAMTDCGLESPNRSYGEVFVVQHLLLQNTAGLDSLTKEYRTLPHQPPTIPASSLVRKDTLGSTCGV